MDPNFSYLSVNPNNSDRSVDPFILAGSWIPIFLAVHRSQYFWPVCESLYSDRSMDPYILSGSWIPIFLSGPKVAIVGPVHRFCFSRKMSCPDKIQIRVRIQSRQKSFLFFEIIQTKSRFFSGPDSNLDTIWTFFQNKNKICPDRIQIQIWILSGPDSFQKKIWTRKPDNLDQKKIWTTFEYLLLKLSTTSFFQLFKHFVQFILILCKVFSLEFPTLVLHGQWFSSQGPAPVTWILTNSKLLYLEINSILGTMWTRFSKKQQR